MNERFVHEDVGEVAGNRLLMFGPSSQSRRWIALGIVAGHALLLVLMNEALRKRRVLETGTTSVLFFVPEQELRLTSPVPSGETQARSDTTVPRAASSVPQMPASEPTPAPSEPRSIDWYAEAERSARAAAPQLLEELRRKCNPSEGLPPPECRERKHEFEWRPEPSKAGFAGGLPYVRLGKRCVVGLGFFGCAVGKLPEANGDLFEGMDDPDRPRSSVPEPPR